LCQHTFLVANPSETEINDLVRKAHINILPSFSSTGIKLKLLHALFEGRHCVVNDAMIDNTDLESTCHSGSNAAALASIIVQLRNQPFTGEEITIRQNVLNEKYDNDRNARIIIQHLW
ncbi:MAG TPA: mannosyltransferase, partial [Chitinophagaceae bacterium]|nr:mannosyltransferase [Chitinophagaceae bacterium]